LKDVGGEVKGKTVASIAQRIGCQVDIKEKITGIEADSRKIEPGNLFVALKGERVDGHSFLGQAVARGAVAALVSKGYQGASFGLPLLFVEDGVSVLQELAREALIERGGRIIAVTGSVGKTTTKEFIATLLGGRFRVVKSLGNQNSQVGLPLTLLNSEERADIFVLEMGMTGLHHIEKLVQMAPPDMAVVTRIGLAHAQFFENGMEEIPRAKAEILSHQKTKRAVIHGETASLEPFKASPLIEKILFGWDQPAFDYSLRRESGELFVAERGVLKGPLYPLFQESHLLEDLSAALAVARSFGMEWQEIGERIPLLKPFERRFERIEREGVLFINDSYNASPESMRAALANLPQPSSGKKCIAVFGEMGELGKYSESAHRSIAECALPLVDHLLCCGRGTLPMVEIFTQKGRPAEFFEELTLLGRRLKEIASAGDIVLLKGSRSNGLWRLLD
jgi:UDP-N-acetylmuramoyl-tripeptide--D-alanyl-D-alanine ligase